MARNTRTFTDLDATFTLNPRTRDVGIKVDDNAVRNAIRNLIHTRNYERPFAPNIGCQLHSLLFENMTPFTLNLAERTIRDVIGKFEPRVELLQVDVNPTADENSLNIQIQYRIINTDQPAIFTTTFTRLR
jgi:phage baseplate assembly protein W